MVSLSTRNGYRITLKLNFVCQQRRIAVKIARDCAMRCVCGHHTKRIHRSRLQRLIYSAAYRCSACGRTSFTLRHGIITTYAVLFSRHSRCFRCGGDHVYRISGPDELGEPSKHPLCILQGLLLAPTVKCPGCRLQFHDFRDPLMS